jgi:hypothetical protein
MDTHHAENVIAAASICLLTSAAHAGDQGDPAQSCDGNTNEMVECLNAKTAQADDGCLSAGPQGRRAAAARPTARGATPMDSISRRQLPVLRRAFSG